MDSWTVQVSNLLFTGKEVTKERAGTFSGAVYWLLTDVCILGLVRINPQIIYRGSSEL